MDGPRLPLWTLSLRLHGDVLECSLGDGHRLAWRADRPADVLAGAAAGGPPATVAALLGDDLAGRLAASPPRPLTLLYPCDEALDALEWEGLVLGSLRLAQHFALSRQLASDAADPPAAAAAGLASSLTALCVRHAAGPSSWGAGLRQIPLAAVDRTAERALVAEADVLLLEGVGLREFLERSTTPSRPRLLVVEACPPRPELAAALDLGASVWCAGPLPATGAGPVAPLLQLLGEGRGVGEALRLLHRRWPETPPGVRLYGDPELRFVRPAPPTTRRQVTSVSFDLVGSTGLLRQLGDEAYAETLETLHRRAADIVRRHGGQSDEPQGDDGVMGYFGHPVALENAAVRAVEAALAIVNAAAELGVHVRAGVATGAVAIKAGQPVGLSIHLAARLQQAAAPGTVLVSEPTRRLVAHAFALELRDGLPALKGVEDETAYLVLGPRREGRDARRGRDGPGRDGAALPPIVGRDAELQRLHAAWRRTQAGAGGLVVVAAEPGMGKSRLVREFRHQLVDTGVRVLEVRCRLDAATSPFLALAEALRRWLDLDLGPDGAHGPHCPHGPRDPDADASAAESRLAASLPPHARQGEPLALLADLLGMAPRPPATARDGPAPAAAGGSGGAAGARARLLGLLVEWLQHFTRGQPCGLIVEDWHWADPSTREYVEHLLRAPAGRALLVVVTTRGARPEPGPVAAGAPFVHEHIELAGLAPVAAHDLVRRICDAAAVAPRLVDQLVQRGDGVPLFLEEAARLALERLGDGRGAAAGALDEVPASLQDLLTARLDALGAAKPVAQVAAVLGRSFTRGLLAALLDTTGHALDAAALDDRLDALRASGLVRAEADGRLVFRHALIRDAAYASLWARERQVLHTRVVALLQQRWPELAAQQPEWLAQHQAEAGLHAEALDQWERAASRAAARSAELEAISHLRHALGVLAHLPAGEDRDRRALRLQLLLAARLLATEGYGAEAVHEAYLEAQRLCDRIGDDTARFKVEMGLEACRFMRAEFVPALEHGRRAAAIAERSGDLKQRLHAHWGLACTLFHQGELRATMREMEAALALYSPELHAQFGIQDPGVMCMAYSSWGLWERGRPDAALARIEHAVSLADAFEHRFSQAVALAYAVSIELLRGDVDPALARADTCQRVCDTFGFPVWLAITRCMRGHLLCERGQFDEGLREMAAGHAQWLGTGARVSQPLYLSLMAEGLLRAGRLPAAAEAVQQGLAIIERYGERQLEAELCRLRGEIERRQGDAAAAEAWWRRAYVRALRRGRLGFALRSATALARHWTEGGQRERARRLLAPLLARWNEGLATRDVAAARALLVTLA